MTRKLLFITILVALFSAIYFQPVMAAKDYHAEQFNVDVVVQPDGSLLVTETIVFRFEGGPFTFAYRELSFHNLDEINNIQASMDRKALARGTQPGQVEVTNGQPIKVTWHFAPVQDSTHEFVLTYQVKGAIRQDTAADSLIWRAIPEEHEYRITRSLIRIEYPVDVAPSVPPSLSVSEAEIESGPTGATFILNGIDADTPVDVSVSFPSHSLVTQPPAWQMEQQQKAQRITTGLPFGLGAAAISTLIGVIAVFLAGRSFRRESVNNPIMTNQSFSTPPRAIPPALAAKLTGSSVPFLGTLFDLAQRGVLRIEEGPKKWSGRTFEVIRQHTAERLQPHEQIFLDALFNKAGKERVDLSDIAALAYNRQFGQALDQELTLAGWRDAERSSRRARFLAVSGIGMVFGLIVIGVGLVTAIFLSDMRPAAIIIGAVLIGAGAAACITGFLGLMVALIISTRSDEGDRQAAIWNSFTGHLRNITRGREPVASPDVFNRYLPYAAGLGLATEWAKFFQKQANTPIPTWFSSLESGTDDGSFVPIMAAITSADSSASFASDGGGGGASGGGSSGAG